MPALKQRLADSNKNLAAAAVSLLGRLAKSLGGRPADRLCRPLLAPALKNLCDQKATVSPHLHACMHAHGGRARTYERVESRHVKAWQQRGLYRRQQHAGCSSTCSIPGTPSVLHACKAPPCVPASLQVRASVIELLSAWSESGAPMDSILGELWDLLASAKCSTEAKVSCAGP